MKYQLKLFLILFVVGGLLINFTACGNDPEEDETEVNQSDGEPMDISADEANTPDFDSLEYIQQGMIDYGKILVRIGGCNNCHSPKVMTDRGYAPDTTRMLAGHWAGDKLAPINLSVVGQDAWLLTHPMLTAYVGPWGVSYAANLTPDPETGIGNWDEAQFLKTMRTGMHMGAEKGRKILPPMPWFNLKETSDHDLQAIFAYLQSIPPIKNKVPDHLTLDQLKQMHPEMLVTK